MDITGKRIIVRGRIAGLTGRNISTLLEWRGAKAARSSARADLCVIAHSCAPAWSERTWEVPLSSEMAFRRAVGLLPPLPQEARAFSADDLARHAGLPVETVAALAIFDVLDTDDDMFGFREVSVAREARRLLESGAELNAILEAGAALRVRGIRLNASALAETPWGDLAVADGDDLATIDGQLELALQEPRLRAEELGEVAEECEIEGDFEEAERLYAVAARIDPKCGVLPFNRGNALVQLGRDSEALASFLDAAKRDREVAPDAYYNAAVLHARRGRADRAEDLYRQALRLDPAHVNARFNLALLLCGQHRYEDAVPLWDALAAEGHDDARRQASLCRMEIMSLRAATA